MKRRIDWLSLFASCFSFSFVLILLLGLAGCDDSDSREARYQARKALWKDALVVKICHDGTFIYLLNDSSYRADTGWSVYTVAGHDVCA